MHAAPPYVNVAVAYPPGGVDGPARPAAEMLDWKATATQVYACVVSADLPEALREQGLKGRLHLPRGTLSYCD